MSPEPAPTTRFCSQCGRPYPTEELARFGEQLICISCKDVFTQRWREGAEAVGSAEYAGFWIRFAALLIDGIILFIVQSVLSAVFLGAAQGARPEVLLATVGLVYLLSFAISATYESLLIARFAATPGKMAVGLKVVRPDGAQLSIGRSIGRHFAKYISSLILGIGYLMVIWDDQKCGLHDKICDTRVIRAR